MSIYKPGHILKLSFPRHEARRGSKPRYGVVLSTREYNTANDHGIVAPISASQEDGPGVYTIGRWKELKLDKPSKVAPWVHAVTWDGVIELVSDLSPYEFRQVQAKLREVIPLGG